MSRTLTSEKDWSHDTDRQSSLVQEAVDTEGRNCRGLKNIARLVGIKISEKGTTCYREIADEIIQELGSAEKRTLTDERSIRRRVYDAINILLAMNFIKKECRSIQWRGPRLDWNDSNTTIRPDTISPSMQKYFQQEQPFQCSSESSELERNIEFVKKPLVLITVPIKDGQICVNSTGDFKKLKLRSSGNVKLFDENILCNVVSNQRQ
ncbi:Transcription factor Dp-1 [Galdieria sulphuraria]|uniref:Transcription factor n=1 Tax=Galdieria sulphuraria TaxID=130081 RepID=M2XPZ7_GALSU|nr:transcription factor [Galdieria sulphuraria]EME32292.1 transcription factor [Galdieria sulphuraria]GJD09727.1 Transcription factor Dp-1 [Galdieria sulphuraria]|eukprot:XP_005708812.1 transcription factor [Galdieria sulphuraria]